MNILLFSISFHPQQHVTLYQAKQRFMKNQLLLIVFVLVAVVGKAQDTSGLYPINNTELYLEIMGEGEPILIVHGGPGLNHEYLLPHLAPLAKKHKLIFYDQRSCGKSQLNVKANMNFATFAADMEAIRVFFHIDKLNILCHSWGALPVATFIQNYPDHVKAVAFINPVPFTDEYAMESSRNAASRVSSADSLKRIEIMKSPEFIAGNVKSVSDLMMLSLKQLLCDTANLTKIDPKLPDNYMVASLSLYGFGREMHDYDFYAQIKDNKTPALIIRGTCDISPEIADTKIAGCFTNAKLYVFEKSGHFAFVEENKLFVKRVNKFFK